MCNQILSEKNSVISRELEQCRTQPTAATAELEKSKEALIGNVPFCPERKLCANHVYANEHSFILEWQDRRRSWKRN